MAPQHIVFYGRGGVGTSTIAANVSASLAETGFRVVQVGFDSRHDSTVTLRGERPVRTILDAFGGEAVPSFAEIVVSGFKGVLCMETGLPSPDVACTGHGSEQLLAFLGGERFLAELNPDFVIYDISGEAVCGGILGTLLHDIDGRVFVVSSADFMSLFAVNDFFRFLGRHATGRAQLGGIIANGLTAPFAETIMADFALKAGTRLAGAIPRSLVVMQSALYGQTVLEASPLANHAFFYRRLSRHLVENDDAFPPRPLSPEELKLWARGWGDMIVELESGIVGRGGGI